MPVRSIKRSSTNSDIEDTFSIGLCDVFMVLLLMSIVGFTGFSIMRQKNIEESRLQ